MNRTRTVLTAGALATALVIPFGPLGAANAGSKGGSSHGAVGLSGGDTLVAFSLSKADRAKKIGTITGLSGDTSIVGIDFRVQDGKLYGVGDQGGVYTFSSKAKATKVSQLTEDLSGENFGVDFNPAADRLRVVSDTGQNLRHDVNPGGATLVDGTLNTPPAITPVSGISAAAYTNNDLDDDTATTLFDIDTAMDQVSIQAPANAGALSPTGKLGVDAGSDAGFDIATHRGENHGFAALSVNGKYRLYSVSLLTGEVKWKGSFPRSAQVSDIAVPTGR